MDGDWRLLVTVLYENWTVPEVSIRTLIRMEIIIWLARGGPSYYLCDLRLYDLGWRYVMRFARMWCDMSAWVQLDYTGWRWLAMWGGCRWLLTAASCATTWHHLALPENILNCALRESGLVLKEETWVELKRTRVGSGLEDREQLKGDWRGKSPR